MNLIELTEFLRTTLTAYEFELIKICDDLTYGGRRAGAAFYHRFDCKLQICWSLREGGLYFMLAPLSAPNQLGLIDEPRHWKAMLMLSTVIDDLETPRPGASSEVVMAWMRDLFELHFESAHSRLITESGRT